MGGRAARLYQAAAEADLILVEGVMGLYDGVPSSADIARRRPARSAQYAVSGRVLSRTRYRMGRTADLAPFDFALGWGRMAEPAVIKRLDISQGGRWYL